MTARSLIAPSPSQPPSKSQRDLGRQPRVSPRPVFRGLTLGVLQKNPALTITRSVSENPNRADFATSLALLISSKNYGKGRVLYNGLGHVPALWDRPDFQKI